MIPAGNLVETPGTAPGSAMLIPNTVYRHSHPKVSPTYIAQAGRNYEGFPQPFGNCASTIPAYSAAP
jgi:hypothetical protein